MRFIQALINRVGGAEIDGSGANPAFAGAARFAVGVGIEFLPPGVLIIVIRGSLDGFGIDMSGHDSPPDITLHIIYRYAKVVCRYSVNTTLTAPIILYF
jgi:hypothetical protein